MFRYSVIELLVIKRPTDRNELAVLDPSRAVPKRLVNKQRLAHAGRSLLIALDLNNETEIAKRNRKGSEIHRGARLPVQAFGDKPNTPNTIKRQHSTLYDLKMHAHLRRVELSQLVRGRSRRQIWPARKEVKPNTAAFWQKPNSRSVAVALKIIARDIKPD